MIYLKFKRIEKIEDAIDLLQMAVELEFSTLPPYLYALYSIKAGTNAEASSRIRSVAMQEMVHMCLACNIINALGTDPTLAVPTYPGPMPGGISRRRQRAADHPSPPVREGRHGAGHGDRGAGGRRNSLSPRDGAGCGRADLMTIGQFYGYLDSYLKTLPPSQWTKGRNQIDDRQFLPGEVLAVNGYDDAHNAIVRIVSEGEGHKKDPLDFQGEVSHYYRFGEMFYDQVLTKADNPLGYRLDRHARRRLERGLSRHSRPRQPRFLQGSAGGAEGAGSMRRGVHASGPGAAEGGHRQAWIASGNAVRAMFDLRMAAGTR